MITARAFEALESGWEAACRAIAQAESELDAAQREFHRTGNEQHLKDAMLRRMLAQAHLRQLMYALWTDARTAEVFAPG
jgi:hypothetical protein